MSDPPRPRTRVLRFVLQVAFVVGVFVAAGAWQTRGLLSEGPAPAISLPALEGKLVSLGELRGKTLLVHFWATWCGVCRAEIPALKALHSKLDSDERLISIVADSEDVQAVRRFVAQHDIRYPVLLATPDVLERYSVSVFPTNYFVGPDGAIRGRSVGMSTRWALAARMGCAAR